MPRACHGRIRRYGLDMRIEAPTRPAEPLEMHLEAACPACGGPLELRIAGASAGTYCRACRWISRPSVRRHGEEIVLAHPLAGHA